MIVGQRDGRRRAAAPPRAPGLARARCRACCGSAPAGRSGRTRSRDRLRGCPVRDRRPRSARTRRAAPTVIAISPPPPAVFERVVEQVGDRLRQQVAVAADHRARRAVEPQRKALLLGERLVQLDDGAGDLGEIERLAAPAAGAGFRLGDAEQRVEGREQPVGLVDRGPDRLALGGAVAAARAAPVPAAPAAARAASSDRARHCR